MMRQLGDLPAVKMRPIQSWPTAVNQTMHSSGSQIEIVEVQRCGRLSCRGASSAFNRFWPATVHLRDESSKLPLAGSSWAKPHCQDQLVWPIKDKLRSCGSPAWALWPRTQEAIACRSCSCRNSSRSCMQGSLPNLVQYMLVTQYNLCEMFY